MRKARTDEGGREAVDVVKDWEKLVADLQRDVENGDKACLALLEKAQQELKKAREAASRGR